MAYAAPDEPLYFVQGVKADKTASSAAVAREKAVNDARKKAYDVVLGRIVLTEEKNKIPNPSNLELVNFVSEMAVMNEKTSSVRYMADLDFRFNSGAIKDYLEKNNIGYVNTVSEPVLLLPVYTNGKEIILAEGENPWLNFLSGIKKENSVVPLVFPVGDEEDIARTQALLSGRYDNEDMENLRGRYGASKIIVAEMQEYEDAKNIAFVVYELDQEGLDDENFNFTVSKNASPDKIKSAALATIRKKIEEDWKKDNVVYFSSASVITVLIPLHDLAEWVKITKKLDKMPIIEHYDLKAMKSDRVQIDIIFGRSIDRLVKLMNEADLILEPVAGGVWALYEKKETSDIALSRKKLDN